LMMYLGSHVLHPTAAATFRPDSLQSMTPREHL
jgi:hypothetical protein